MGGLVSSPETIQRLLDKGTRAIVNTYDVCRNGCFLFNDSFINLRCPNPECNTPRYKEQKRAERLINEGIITTHAAFQTMGITSVASSLAELLIDDNIREDFQYSNLFNDHDENMYSDIFSGSVYKSFRQQNLISPNDICIVLYVDGFPNKNKSKSSQTLIHCMIMNIPPSKRYNSIISYTNAVFLFDLSLYL